MTKSGGGNDDGDGAGMTPLPTGIPAKAGIHTPANQPSHPHPHIQRRDAELPYAAQSPPGFRILAAAGMTGMVGVIPAPAAIRARPTTPAAASVGGYEVFGA